MKEFYVPSFQIERKTKALNPYLWGFAALISMFVFVLLVLAPHLFLVSFLEIISTFLYDHMTLLVPAIIMILALMFGIGLFQFLNTLLYAYTVEENRIVRGKITNQAADMNVALDVLAVKYMIKHLDEPQKVNAAQTASNMFRIIRRIQYNMNEAFEGDPTANENITAGNVVVAGVNGAVVVKGAEGKNVIVSTILGKVVANEVVSSDNATIAAPAGVANEVVSSDNATIAAPAGVVVVSVDGESFKVVVK